MTKTKINAEVVADSLSPQGDRLTSLLITFPRIILAEVNTHRMLSKNTSSSRAITFRKMLQAIKENPFIPIAWQKEHSGMQGSEYFNSSEAEILRMKWLRARDRAIESALDLASGVFDVNEVFEYDEEGELIVLQTGIGVTKQLVNRLLEPFMWTTMLITSSKEGWDNFFELRNPVYEIDANVFGIKQFKSKKDAKNYCDMNGVHYYPSTNEEWLRVNKGQAEIHMMALAECIYDAMNESTPKQLKAGEWHIPFGDKLNKEKISELEDNFNHSDLDQWEIPVKISTSMAARTSYTVIGDEKEIDYERMIGLHDRLIAQNPPHSSPMEHCARAMSDEEYYASIKTTNYPLLIPRNKKDIEINGGFVNQELYPQHKQYGENIDRTMYGWCRNYRGFIQYRHLVEKYLIYKRPQYGTR